MAWTVNNLPAMRETQDGSLGWEDMLEEEVATHSSILAWKIPWREVPGRLQSWGHKESDMTEQHFTFIKRLFNSSLLSAIRVLSSVYLKLLIFLLAVLIQLGVIQPSILHYILCI